MRIERERRYRCTRQSPREGWTGAAQAQRAADQRGGDSRPGAAPDLPLVNELVARAAGSGLDVTLLLEGDRESLAPDVTRTAYRVVQEGLTNALRHAPGSAVTIRLCGDATGLLVEVVNGPPTRATSLAASGTGNGLRGLHERVSACAGSLEAGPQADGGWRLAVRMPRHAAITTT